MNNDELLTALSERADEILNNLRPFVDKYRQTLNGLATSDISRDDEYRRNFTRFYRLRLPRAACYDDYFALLERNKNNPDLRFEAVLTELQQSTGRIEASFASKLIATIDPYKPVIDRIVLNVLGERLPYCYQTNREQSVIDLYHRLIDRLAGLQQDDRFDALSGKFRAEFPDYGFTDLKMLDLMVWLWGKNRV